MNYVDRFLYKTISLIGHFQNYQNGLMVESTSAQGGTNIDSDSGDIVSYETAYLKQKMAEDFGVVFSIFLGFAEIFIMPVFTLVGIGEALREGYSLLYNPEYFESLTHF